jgi:hypothetical protein
MSVIKKKSAKRTISGKRTVTEQTTYAIVSDKVGNYANDPYFVKKANAAKELLERVGLPKSFTTRAK